MHPALPVSSGDPARAGSRNNLWFTGRFLKNSPKITTQTRQTAASANLALRWKCLLMDLLSVVLAQLANIFSTFQASVNLVQKATIALHVQICVMDVKLESSQ